MSQPIKSMWMIKFLEWFCPPDLFESIEGDLLQRYQRDIILIGERRARRWLIWNALKFFRPGIVLRNKFSLSTMNSKLLQNYVVVAFRSMRRHLLYSYINVLSLSIGLAACIVIYLFIRDESLFDQFHSKKDQIFRLNELQLLSNNSFQKVALTGSPFGPGLRDEFPEILNFTRIEEFDQPVLRRGSKQLLLEKPVFIVDSTFLEIFDFKLLYGDSATLLDSPSSIVLTKQTALKFFDSPDGAIGKSVMMADREDEYIITGILDDIPEQSHLQFDALTSYVAQTQKHPEYNTDWVGNGSYTYFLLRPDADPKKLEAKFPEWLIRWTGSKDVNSGFGIYFQALSDIHLQSVDIEHDYHNYRKFNGRYLTVFALIGLLIMIIAALNFTNLTVARSSYRWKEIGIRKSIGAVKRQLMVQFIFESILLSLIAVSIAIALDAICLPLLNDWIGIHLEITSLLSDIRLLGLVLSAAVVVGMFAALYPSWYMTSQSLVTALKGSVQKEGRHFFQGTLVVIQFGLALSLMVGTLMTMKQLSFIRNQDLGFKKDQILLVSLNKEANQKLELIKNQLNELHAISGVTASGQRMGNTLHQTVFKVKGENGFVSGFNSFLNVDEDYLDVYKIPLVKGRGFSKNVLTDKGGAFLINESMADELQLADPIGAKSGYDDTTSGKIIGVVKDFKFNSLHHKVTSLSIVCQPQWGYSELSILLNSSNIDESLASIKSIWGKNISSLPFTYSFLDDHFEKIYKQDTQLGRVVKIMAVLSVLISCMGLFALTAIITGKRTKEIAIRKVLGASEWQIVNILSRNFIMLVVLSFVLITPVTYYVLVEWLSTFAYHTNVDPYYFLFGGFMAIMLAFLTTSFHTIKTARSNPVDSLKND